MKRTKLVLTLLSLGLLALLIYQNQAYFLQNHILSINLYFAEYSTPEIPEGFFWLIAFIAGFLLIYLSNFMNHIRIRAYIRILDKENKEYLDIIDTLSRELKKQQESSEMPLIKAEDNQK